MSLRGIHEVTARSFTKLQELPTHTYMANSNLLSTVEVQHPLTPHYWENSRYCFPITAAIISYHIRSENKEKAFTFKQQVILKLQMSID